MLSSRPRLRLAALFVAGVACSLLALFAVHQLVLPVLAWVFPSLQSPFYDLAVYGGYPQRHYVSHNLSSPDLLHVQWDDQCDNGYIFISPQGESVKNPGPMILDARGNLVWQSDQYGKAMNLKVQKYKGQNFVTFWAGHRDSSFGSGSYYMLDTTYTEVHRVRAAGEHLKGDLHEFQLTKDGTALISIYNKTQADMTSMGRGKNGWVNNCLFQEVDVETGELLFEWNALDHFSVADSYMTHPLAGYWESIPFDFFHINSASKDSNGDFLISARHLHALMKVNGSTGEVIWSLGGRYNDFKDLSDGKATDFKWQHDGRWVSEEDGILTLFDNSDAGPLHLDAPYSTGRMIQLDFVNKTAKLLHSYVSAKYTRAASQGSVQVLPESNNNVFVGWGHSPVYNEYSANGTLLCEAHFGAQYVSYYGRITSYRSLKNFEWVGEPIHPPKAKIVDGELFVSWLGATEVVQWTLQGSTSTRPDEFTDMDVLEKIGFESSFILPKGDIKYYRVAALDRDGNVLRHSEVATEQSGRSIWRFLAPLAGLLGATVGVWVVYRHRKGKPLSWKKYKYSRL